MRQTPHVHMVHVRLLTVPPIALVYGPSVMAAT